MTQVSYAKKLKNPLWQKKRLEVLSRDNFTCKECGSTSDTLNVHHGYYAFKTEPWEYPDETLHSVCETCHKVYEEIKAALYRELGKFSISDLQEVFRIVTSAEDQGPFDHDVAREKIMNWIVGARPNLHQLRTYMNENYPDASIDFKSEFFKYAKGGACGTH